MGPFGKGIPIERKLDWEKGANGYRRFAPTVLDYRFLLR